MAPRGHARRAKRDPGRRGLSAAVAFERVRFAYGVGGFGLAIDGFEMGEAERLLLVGPSGSGKSTLLGLVTGVLVADAGRVAVLGTDLGKLGATARDRFRAAHVGVLFQMFNLLPYLSVLDNVLLPLRFAPERRRRLERGGARDEALGLLDALGLAPGLASARADRLSVGQQQRVAAARALIGAPEIVVADEPTSALDRDRRAAFLDLLFAQAARRRTALLVVSHDGDLAPLFDRVADLRDVAAPAPA